MVVSITVLTQAIITVGQDFGYSMISRAPIQLNPALAGTAQNDSGTGAGRVMLNSRNQWVNLPVGVNGITVSYDQHVNKIGGAFGVTGTREVAMERFWNTVSGSMVYSQYLNLGNKLSIRLGAEAQVVNRSYSWVRIPRIYDDFDPSYYFVDASKLSSTASGRTTFFNLNGGLLLYTRAFYGGLAVHNSTQPYQKIGDSLRFQVPRSVTFHGGYQFVKKGKSGKTVSLTPHLLYQKQGQIQQFGGGCYVAREAFIFGAWCRNIRSVGLNEQEYLLVLGYRMNNVRVGYGYEIHPGEVNQVHASSHEIHLAYVWQNKNVKSVVRSMPSPWVEIDKENDRD